MRIFNKKSGLLLFISSGIFLSVVFNNCQKQLQNIDPTDSKDSPSSEMVSTQNLNIDPFASSKIQINLEALNNSKNSSQQKLTNLAKIPAGTKLIVIASNECMLEAGTELSQSIYKYDQEFKNLDVQSYTWTTEKDQNLNDLQLMADQDPCIKGLANDGLVSAATMGPNDPLLSSENHFLSIGGTETYSFFSDKSHGSLKPVIVATIDSGISATHPDLVKQLWRGPSNEIGYNYKNPSAEPIDDFGHGTNVSGIIAAQSNDGVGVSGVMGHNIQLMTIKVQDNTGAGSISDMISAINYARAHSADVINISMVGYGANAALQSALQSASTDGIFIAVAAGNNAIGISAADSSTYAVPAMYGSAITGMLTVGSVITYTNVRSSFSNYSTTYVEIAAPGSGGLYFPMMPTGYKTGEGTSYSSPQVAAAGALVISFFKQHNISYTAATIKNILIASAFQSPSAVNYFTQGRVLDLRGLKEYLQLTYIGAQAGGFSDF